jgi:hypothetical protein
MKKFIIFLFFAYAAAICSGQTIDKVYVGALPFPNSSGVLQVYGVDSAWVTLPGMIPLYSDSIHNHKVKPASYSGPVAPGIYWYRISYTKSPYYKWITLTIKKEIPFPTLKNKHVYVQRAPKGGYPITDSFYQSFNGEEHIRYVEGSITSGTHHDSATITNGIGSYSNGTFFANDNTGIDSIEIDYTMQNSSGKDTCHVYGVIQVVDKNKKPSAIEESIIQQPKIWFNGYALQSDKDYPNVELYDLSGRLVIRGSIKNNTMELAHSAPKVYIIQVIEGNSIYKEKIAF